MNIIKKELKELLTPATILPMVVVVIIFMSIGNSISEATDVTKKPVIGLIDEDNSTYSAIARAVLNVTADVVYNGTSADDIQEALATVKEKGGVAVFVIPGNFTEAILAENKGPIDVFWFLEGVGIADNIETGIADSLLLQINSAISIKLLEEKNVSNITTVLSPTYKNETTFFKGKELVGHSPNEIVGMFMSQAILIPIMMMMIIMTSGTTVITSMGLEKENKTLETLLTLPVPRTYIVLGKIIGASIVGLILAGLYMIGFGSYMNSFNAPGAVTAEELGLGLTGLDYVLVGLLVFLSILAALALCMVLGAFVKDYKSAQTMTAPIVFLVMIPMFATMFFDFTTMPAPLQALIFAIPFSHPMMAINNLMAGQYLIVLGGVVYVALFSAAMMALAVWIFNSDRLLTGVVKRQTVEKLKKVFSRQRA